jgi:hypothetical protein
MGYDTVKYYLENIPNKIKIIVSSNSNLNMNSDDKKKHQEILIDNFPVPKTFTKCFSTVQIPFFSNWRYKTQVWVKNN